LLAATERGAADQRLQPPVPDADHDTDHGVQSRIGHGFRPTV
jgi:hypothetical protein